MWAETCCQHKWNKNTNNTSCFDLLKIYSLFVQNQTQRGWLTYRLTNTSATIAVSGTSQNLGIRQSRPRTWKDKVRSVDVKHVLSRLRRRLACIKVTRLFSCVTFVGNSYLRKCLLSSKALGFEFLHKCVGFWKERQTVKCLLPTSYFLRYSPFRSSRHVSQCL